MVMTFLLQLVRVDRTIFTSARLSREPIGAHLEGFPNTRGLVILLHSVYWPVQPCSPGTPGSLPNALGKQASKDPGEKHPVREFSAFLQLLLMKNHCS